ncbi:carboxylesterase family protein [Niveomyces insectorum RCEF 264]|uniref:Carboxylesterase family protein n=1 Tax=Niveomyces insectorum RCEF 264 TaxID=1081102 RepID=A0A167Z9J0_9HYPO|nr:carboxylesterase family protein [Niveomyces insectorum RCEF 264]
MTHQLRARNYLDILQAPETRHLTNLTEDRSSSPSNNVTTTGGRSRSHLEELNVNAVQNGGHPLTTLRASAGIGTGTGTGPDTPQTNKHIVTATGLSSEGTITPESLAEDLRNFHIHSPENDGVVTVEPHQVAWRNTTIRKGNTAFVAPNAASPTRQPLRTTFKQKRTRFALSEPLSDRSENVDPQLCGSSKHEPSSEEAHVESYVQRTLEEHDANKFSWVLSLPGNAGDLLKNKHLRRICSAADLTDSASQNRETHFGCNLLRHRPRSGSDLTGQPGPPLNTYTFIASPLSSNVNNKAGQQPPANKQMALAEQVADGARGVSADAKPADTSTTNAALLASAGAMPAPDVSPPDGQSGTSLQVLSDGLNAGSASRSQSVPRSPCSSVSRIEDTIEELDRLEDEFEAVKRMVRVDRVPSPDKPVPAGASRAGTGAGTGTAKKPAPSARKPGTTTGSAKSPANAAKAAPGASGKRLSVSRPASLLPPKPPAKSSKPLTVSNYELPGEAVARRLKEQREARMQAAMAASKTPATPSTVPRRARSTKVPTIPTFELPGEAISRRKREEHEAKLKRQAEEEQKRRAFKARPIRLSITPSTLPRETVASRARQNRVSSIGEHGTNSHGRPSLGVPSASGNKRLSMAASTSSGRPAGPGSGQTSRGRGSNLGSPSATTQTSRAASTSTGSVSGMRSSISVEDVQHQKLRGKEILHRDNYLSIDRNRERREREAAAKQARQEAAERSRALSREWAEKQKLRAKKAANVSTEA